MARCRAELHCARSHERRGLMPDELPLESGDDEEEEAVEDDEDTSDEEGVEAISDLGLRRKAARAISQTSPGPDAGRLDQFRTSDQSDADGMVELGGTR